MQAYVSPPGVSAGAIPVLIRARGLWKEAKFNSEATLNVMQDLVSGMAPLEGRKAIVLTSSGFLTGEPGTATGGNHPSRCVRAGIVINSAGSTRPVGSAGVRY